MKPWQSALPIPIVEGDYFRAVLRLLEEADREGSANLVLLGIELTYPSEKYGYIMPASQEVQSEVQSFKESRIKKRPLATSSKERCGTAVFLRLSSVMCSIKPVSYSTIQATSISSIAMRNLTRSALTTLWLRKSLNCCPTLQRHMARYKNMEHARRSDAGAYDQLCHHG